MMPDSKQGMYQGGMSQERGMAKRRAVGRQKTGIEVVKFNRFGQFRSRDVARHDLAGGQGNPPRSRQRWIRRAGGGLGQGSSGRTKSEHDLDFCLLDGGAGFSVQEDADHLEDFHIEVGQA